jgi:hypothetical protein
MVGSGAAGGGGGDHARSKEAAGMMALHEALRNVCLNSDWTYSVFWTIRPRPYASSFPPPCFYIPLRRRNHESDTPPAIRRPAVRLTLNNPVYSFAPARRCRGGNGCKIGDDNGSL